MFFFSIVGCLLLCVPTLSIFLYIFLRSPCCMRSKIITRHNIYIAKKDGTSVTINSSHAENEIDMLVFQTLSEDDLRTIGIESFGVRRKLSLLVQRMKSPPIETLTPCDITMPETTQNSISPNIEPTKPIPNTCPENICTVKEPFIQTPRKMINLNIKEAMENHPEGRELDTCLDNGGILSSKQRRLLIKICINLNIKEAMENHPEGRELDTCLDNGGILSSKQRRLLIKICVSALVEKCGLYPTSEQKTMLAVEIIRIYPAVIDNTPGMKGYEHLYDNGHGFIEYRLKNMRTARPDERRGQKRKMEVKTTAARPIEKGIEDEQLENVELTQDINEKISWMKYNAPSHDKMGKHLDYFKETFKHRRNAIKYLEMTTITSIIEEYPRFKDVPDMVTFAHCMYWPICYTSQQTGRKEKRFPLHERGPSHTYCKMSRVEVMWKKWLNQKMKDLRNHFYCPQEMRRIQSIILFFWIELPFLVDKMS